MSPEAVLRTMEEACNAHDIENAMGCFDQSAFVTFVPATDLENVIRGTEQLRNWLLNLFAGNIRIEVQPVSVLDNIIITNTFVWMDWLCNLEVAPLLAKEIYVIQEGKIMGLTLVWSNEASEIIKRTQATN